MTTRQALGKKGRGFGTNSIVGLWHESGNGIKLIKTKRPTTKPYAIKVYLQGCSSVNYNKQRTANQTGNFLFGTNFGLEKGKYC